MGTGSSPWSQAELCSREPRVGPAPWEGACPPLPRSSLPHRERAPRQACRGCVRHGHGPGQRPGRNPRPSSGLGPARFPLWPPATPFPPLVSLTDAQAQPPALALLTYPAKPLASSQHPQPFPAAWPRLSPCWEPAPRQCSQPISAWGSYLWPGEAALDSWHRAGWERLGHPRPRARPGPGEVTLAAAPITSRAGGSGLSIQRPVRGAQITRSPAAPPHPRPSGGTSLLGDSGGILTVPGRRLGRVLLAGYGGKSAGPPLCVTGTASAGPGAARATSGHQLGRTGPIFSSQPLCHGPPRPDLSWLPPCTIHPEPCLTPSQLSFPTYQEPLRAKPAKGIAQCWCVALSQGVLCAPVGGSLHDPHGHRRKGCCCGLWAGTRTQDGSKTRAQLHLTARRLLCAGGSRHKGQHDLGRPFSEGGQWPHVYGRGEWPLGSQGRGH